MRLLLLFLSAVVRVLESNLTLCSISDNFLDRVLRRSRWQVNLQVFLVPAATCSSGLPAGEANARKLDNVAIGVL